MNTSSDIIIQHELNDFNKEESIYLFNRVIFVAILRMGRLDIKTFELPRKASFQFKYLIYNNERWKGLISNNFIEKNTAWYQCRSRTYNDLLKSIFHGQDFRNFIDLRSPKS